MNTSYVTPQCKQYVRENNVSLMSILINLSDSKKYHFCHFSRRWLFYKCIFTSLINGMYIIRAYILNKNLIGIFRVGVEF